MPNIYDLVVLPLKNCNSTVPHFLIKILQEGISTNAVCLLSLQMRSKSDLLFYI